jgi:hypothetical protein
MDWLKTRTRHPEKQRILSRAQSPPADTSDAEDDTVFA